MEIVDITVARILDIETATLNWAKPFNMVVRVKCMH